MTTREKYSITYVYMFSSTSMSIIYSVYQVHVNVLLTACLNLAFKLIYMYSVQFTLYLKGI